MERRREKHDSTYIFSVDQQNEVRKTDQKYQPYVENRQALSVEEEKLAQLCRLGPSDLSIGKELVGVAGSLCDHGISLSVIR